MGCTSISGGNLLVHVDSTQLGENEIVLGEVSAACDNTVNFDQVTIEGTGNCRKSSNARASVANSRLSVLFSVKDTCAETNSPPLATSMAATSVGVAMIMMVTTMMSMVVA